MYLGFIPWYAGLAQGGIARAGQTQLAQPLLTLAWAWLLLGEPFDPWMIVAAAAVPDLRRRDPALPNQMTGRRHGQEAAVHPKNSRASTWPGGPRPDETLAATRAGWWQEGTARYEARAVRAPP